MILWQPEVPAGSRPQMQTCAPEAQRWPSVRESRCACSQVLPPPTPPTGPVSLWSDEASLSACPSGHHPPAHPRCRQLYLSPPHLLTAPCSACPLDPTVVSIPRGSSLKLHIQVPGPAVCFSPRVSSACPQTTEWPIYPVQPPCSTTGPRCLYCSPNPGGLSSSF